MKIFCVCLFENFHILLDIIP